MAKWIGESGMENDIVVSSRVRLARNIKKYYFPTIQEAPVGETVIKEVYNSVVSVNPAVKKGFQLRRMADLTGIQVAELVEKHLISPQLALNREGGAVLFNEEESLIIMVNEEDHIRIQALLPGLQLEESLLKANQMDDVIEEQIDYAFEDGSGYLTACPTNVGTGMRASVMLHLPALTLSGQIHGMMHFANKIGLAVRGVYGEGSDFTGNLYQISNQVTLGISEEEIIEKLREVTLQIVEKERTVRQALVKEQPEETADQVHRALGTLKSARIITMEEAMKLLSSVQLGASLKLLEGFKLEKLHQLLTRIQPGSLQTYYKEALDERAQNIKRADLLREELE